MPDIFYQAPRVNAPIIFFKERPPVPKSTPLSKLSPGAGLSPGESLVSPNGVYRFILQTDGNLVLYNKANAPLWASGTDGQGGNRLVMQTDGNLVLYTPDMRPLWSSASDGHPGAFFQMQDDGNAVVYIDAAPLWDSRTWGGYYHGESGSWLSNIVKAAGRPFADMAHNVAYAFGQIGDNAAQVPIVGPALHGVLLVASGPFNFTDSIIQGERLDRALIDDFRNKLTAIREVAPYAKTIMSFVPGIGTGVAAAIGAGLAIAQGMPLDQALLAGIASAVPGGVAGQAIFKLTVAAASGDNLITAAGRTGIDALGLDPTASEALKKSLDVVYRASKGENIPLAALQEARTLVPKEALPAYDVAVAVAQGKRLQDLAASEIANLAPSQIERIKNVGEDVIRNTPALKAASDIIAQGKSTATQFNQSAHGAWSNAQAVMQPVKDGFDLGVGLMRHGGVNEDTVRLVRGQLPTDQEKQGFDMGLAAYKAAVQNKTPPNVTPDEQAGFLLGKGITDNPNPETKQETVKYFLVNPAAKTGVTRAIIIAQKKRETFWEWLTEKVKFW